MNEQFLTSLADQARIIEVVSGFGLAIDLHDWEKFQSLFADVVEFDYSSIQGPAGNFKPEEIVNDARRDLEGFQATQHVITNHQVKLSGNSATCQAHVRAMHFLPNKQGDASFEMGGYYTIGLIRNAPDWKIKQWRFAVLWSRGNGDLFRLAREA